MHDFKIRRLIHGKIVNSEGMETDYWENKSLSLKEVNFVWNLEKYTTNTSPPSRAECHEIWEPKPPGNLWATPGLLRDSFTFLHDEYLRTLCPSCVTWNSTGEGSKKSTQKFL